MNNLTADDYDTFRIDFRVVQGDFVDRIAYSVFGKYTDYYGVSTEDVLVDDLNSKQFAEAWLRVYLEKCVRDKYFDG